MCVDQPNRTVERAENTAKFTANFFLKILGKALLHKHLRGFCNSFFEGQSFSSHRRNHKMVAADSV
jgi:hypothetical protein